MDSQIELLTQELCIQPSVEKYMKRAILYQCRGEHERAIGDLTAILTNHPLHTEAMFRRGISLRLLKQFDAAAEDLVTVEEIEPNRQNLRFDYTNPTLRLFGSMSGPHFMSIV